jgi:hypothetical protein
MDISVRLYKLPYFIILASVCRVKSSDWPVAEGGTLQKWPLMNLLLLEACHCKTNYKQLFILYRPYVLYTVQYR